MNDDDFFIPTGEELDRGDIPRKPLKRSGPLKWFRRQRHAPHVQREARRIELEVPESVSAKAPSVSPDKTLGGDTLIDTGSSGHVVRRVDASERSARRDLIIPLELREKYGLDQ